MCGLALMTTPFACCASAMTNSTTTTENGASIIGATHFCLTLTLESPIGRGIAGWVGPPTFRRAPVFPAIRLTPTIRLRCARTQCASFNCCARSFSGFQTHAMGWPPASEAADSASYPGGRSSRTIREAIDAFLRVGALTGSVALIEAISLAELALRSLPGQPENSIFRLLEVVAGKVRRSLENGVEKDDDVRCKWEIIDIALSAIVGMLRFGLMTDPRGFDAIDDYECRDWLRLNGASERSLELAYLRGLYDLGLAYVDGDPACPGIAAGQALRASFRFFLSYRGALFWKMRASMGDVMFVPFYDILVKRGVTFEFFHRLTNVKIADQIGLALGNRPHVEALEFDVQAKCLTAKPYQPLIETNGVRCWPNKPHYSQLEAGETLQATDFELHWERRKVETKTLTVSKHFDCVVLGVSLGALPHVCREILAVDERWRDMVANVKTVATQAFQIWLNEDLQGLGWMPPPVTIAGYAKPFETWPIWRKLFPRNHGTIPPAPWPTSAGF